MTTLQGFWSYVHDDDDAEGGRISQLARDVVGQYGMLTGEEIDLFLDKDAIEWGEKWRDKIDTSLASVGFFVSVLTPRYFMSVECRRELQFFARRAVDLGVKSLILPLLYVDFPNLHDQASTDDLVKLVREFQWEDWRELRFSDVKSGEYRKNISNLAHRIVEANRQAEDASHPVVVTSSDVPKDMGSIDNAIAKLDEKPLTVPPTIEDEQLGTIDILADTEEKMNKVPVTLDAMTNEILKFGEIMRQTTADMKEPVNAKSGFAYRQMISRRLANHLQEPTERLWLLSNELSSDLHAVDKGYRIIIGRANDEIKDNIESKASFCSFFNSVRGMVESFNNSIPPIEGMIKNTEPLDKLSRDLRPVMRRLRQGLTIMLELRGLYQEWIDLIDGTGISCDSDDVPNQPEN